MLHPSIRTYVDFRLKRTDFEFNRVDPVRDFHPRDDARAGRTQKSPKTIIVAQGFIYVRCSLRQAQASDLLQFIHPIEYHNGIHNQKHQQANAAKTDSK